MANDATTRKPIRPIKAGEISPPIPDAEEKLRAIAEAQGVILDGKAWERLFGAEPQFSDGDEEFERFMEILRERRKQG